jgi:WD40 repeat protein
VADRDEIKVYDSVAGGDPLWSGPIEASVSINFVAFTPDASAVIAVTDTVVVVLDTNTQTELSRFEVEIQIADIDISADGKLIALAIDQNHGGNHQNVGSAQVWDWAQKTKTLQVTPQNAVFTVALSPDTPTSMLLLSSADNSNQIVLLDDTAEPLWIEGGEEDKQQGKETVGASHTAFGPKAKNVILGDSWGLARVLDAESGIQRSRSEHNGAVTHVALMANRKWAASIGIDNMLVVFNAESAGQLYTASTLEATAMAVSPNSRYVALGHLGSFVVYDNGETA